MSTTPFAQLNDSIATDYDRENRSVPRLFARHLISLLPLLSSSHVIHDNACGPAVVTSELLASLSSSNTDDVPQPKVHATDLSESMIQGAQGLIEKNAWENVDAVVMDSLDLKGFSDDCFDISITNFGIFLLPDPIKAAAEVNRTLKPSGVALTTSWKFHGWLDLMRRISRVIRPEAELEGISANSPTSKEELIDSMVRAGFAREKVEVSEHREWLRFEDEADLGELMGTGKIAQFVTKDWEDGERASIKEVVRGAATEEEWRMKAIPMVAWVVVATK